MKQEIHHLLTILLQVGLLVSLSSWLVLIGGGLFMYLQGRKERRLQNERDLARELLYR